MSRFIDDLDQKMNIRSWPHQFTKTGSQTEIGENRNFEPTDGGAMKIMSQEMICVHCHETYWTIKSGPPPPPCPARNKQREMKRILR